MSALIFLGFCAMGAGAYFTSTMSFARMMMSGAALPLVFGSFILTIVGMVMMSAAASKQSVGLSLVGYVVFASTFGLTASFGLANYDLPTINTAFIATAAITFVFGAGRDLPKFFQRVYGIGFGILLATILVEIVLMFMGVSQSITDLIVIVVFAGFIGYDTYVATTVPPTLPNAVLMASNLFVDIINVFLRILNILGRRD
ncbi:MAG: Bax inhibitor-1 family protein [Collinsella sp.]